MHNPITRHLPNLRTIFQSMFDPITGHIPKSLGNFSVQEAIQSQDTLQFSSEYSNRYVIPSQATSLSAGSLSKQGTKFSPVTFPISGISAPTNVRSCRRIPFRSQENKIRSIDNPITGYLANLRRISHNTRSYHKKPFRSLAQQLLK